MKALTLRGLVKQEIGYWEQCVIEAIDEIDDKRFPQLQWSSERDLTKQLALLSWYYDIEETLSQFVYADCLECYHDAAVKLEDYLL